MRRGILLALIVGALLTGCAKSATPTAKSATPTEVSIPEAGGAPAAPTRTPTAFATRAPSPPTATTVPNESPGYPTASIAAPFRPATNAATQRATPRAVPSIDSVLPPTPSPAAFKRYTPDDVARVLTPLGASNFVFTPRDPQSPAPNTTIDQRTFTIPSVAPRGGQALFFDSAADVAGMVAYFTRFPDLAPYVYAKGNVVLQLNSGVAKVEAEKYRMALESLP